MLNDDEVPVAVAQEGPVCTLVYQVLREHPQLFARSRYHAAVWQKQGATLVLDLWGYSGYAHPATMSRYARWLAKEGHIELPPELEEKRRKQQRTFQGKWRGR